MTVPAHYLTIKPIFNLSLFGVEDAEKYLSQHEKIVFSKEFLHYQSRFLLLAAPDENELLLKTCVHYLPSLNKRAKKDIVKVLLENKPVSDSLIMLTSFDMGLLDSEEDQYAEKFHLELNGYIEKNSISPCSFLFLQKHFIKFKRINPAAYQNFELTRSEYTDLVSDYMKVQSVLL